MQLVKLRSLGDIAIRQTERYRRRDGEKVSKDTTACKERPGVDRVCNIWRMYDSNTSRSPTASNRRGPKAARGDLKARAWVEQDAPMDHVSRGVWPAPPVKNAPSSCAQTPTTRYKRWAGIQPQQLYGKQEREPSPAFPGENASARPSQSSHHWTSAEGDARVVTSQSLRQPGRQELFGAIISL